VLDACVLFPASLRDTLLRLAETPRQYIPKSSDRILEEVTRNLERRRNLAPRKIVHLIGQIERHFPEARVTGYEKLIGVMTNDPKDRHVAAAAVQSGAQVIVTSNLRDFPAASLLEWDIDARHPDEFLVDLLGHHPAAVISKLQDQAATIGRTIPELLQPLQTGVPRFAAKAASRPGLDIPAQVQGPFRDVPQVRSAPRKPVKHPKEVPRIVR
jgi:predicted nucleic acid-binding protein